MTVSELIEQLKNYPGDMRVLILGYEGGLDDIDLKVDHIVFNVNRDTWYYGLHDYADYDENKDVWPGTECLIIRRGK